MKVLHLTTDLGLGGRERVVVDLSNALLKKGYTPYICCLRRSGEWAEKLSNEIKVFELHKKDCLDFSIVRPIINLLNVEQINILHTHNPGTLLYGLCASKMARTKVLINTEHGFGHKISIRTRFKDGILYRLTDQITTVSDKLQKDIIKLYGLSKNNVIALHNGITMEKIEEDPDISKIRYDMPTDHINIGIVARLVPVKNHAMLLNAFAEVRRKNPKTRLWIVGSGILKKELVKQVKYLNIENDVIFMGSRSDVPTILNAFDIFVLCSISEGFSVTLLEAMCAGLPIIATNVGGNVEAIEHGKSGLLIDNDNSQELANAILRLISDNNMAKKLGRAAQERYFAEFSINKMADKITNLYEKIWLEKNTL